jgi:hypothetical protein
MKLTKNFTTIDSIFKIGDLVWFINDDHQVTQAKIKKIEIEIEDEMTIKYMVDLSANGKFKFIYVRNIFPSKESLIDSLS